MAPSVELAARGAFVLPCGGTVPIKAVEALSARFGLPFGFGLAIPLCHFLGTENPSILLFWVNNRKLPHCYPRQHVYS
jgi:hypothetical protein